jgi:peptidoglycan/xylan/chitin deacetylase (PgdA/CDA1 family)
MIRRWLAMCGPLLLLAIAAAGLGLGFWQPLSAALWVLFGSLGLLIGVVFPRTRVYADCLSRVPGPGVALTFDDGPHPETTRRVLSLLAEHGQRATFFVIGRKVDAYPDVVREIAQQGHEIGVHGFAHGWLYAFKLPSRVHADVRRCQEAVRRAAGVTPTLFRPPLGLTSPFTAEGAHRAGVTLVAWSRRFFDGVAWRNPDRIVREFQRLRSGDVVLLHDAAESETFTPASVQVLPQILGIMRARGLSSSTLSSARKATAEERTSHPVSSFR